MDSFDLSKNFLTYPSADFILPDFADHVDDFNLFGQLIPGDTIDHDSGFIDENMLGDPQGHMFGLNDSAISDPDDFVFMDGYPSLFMEGEKNGEDDDDEDDDDGDHSSGTTTTTNTTSPTLTKKTKADRSKTLVSERRRRGRMKEKLYALRALVPNITKMDKASIVGDAVLYVQDLQKQAKKLKAEIGDLEGSLVEAKRYQHNNEGHPHHHVISPTQPIYRKILQKDVFQVEERGFYLKVVSNRGFGVAMSLYKALESLTSFNVQSSNLASASSPDRFILTSTLTIKEGEQDMDLPNVKLWITRSLLHQGFELAISQECSSSRPDFKTAVDVMNTIN